MCANIAEGWRKRRYERHFISKLSDADGEAAETRVFLNFAFHCGYLEESDYIDLDIKLGMALALLTTLYGVFFANIFFGPVAAKLALLNTMEVASRELTLEGILAIREGASPRHLVERLEAYLEPELRVGSKARLEAA